jgi:hypothetical protein
MTEAEWQGSDPQKMLEFLRGKVSDRKLRLFAAACCRRIWPLLTDEQDRLGVEVAERHADRLATDEQVLRARAGLRGGKGHPAVAASLWLPSLPWLPEVRGEEAASSAAGCAVMVTPVTALYDEVVAQAGLLRDIVGPLPFRLLRIASSSLTPDVRALAEAAYQERFLPQGHLDPQRLSVLADALEEAGCADASVLGHLRDPGPHYRGCFVVDLVRGKS